MAPVETALSSSESVAVVESESEEEQRRKTISLAALLTPLHNQSDRLSRSGQMCRDYQEKPSVLKLHTKLLESKESSVCSSVLSSLESVESVESVESNTSEGEKNELFIRATAGRPEII